MIIFPGVIGTIATNKSIAAPPAPLTYGLTGDAYLFDNRITADNNPPGFPYAVKTFILNANGSGTETVTLQFTDFSMSPNSLTVSFSSSGSLLSTSISGGSTKTIYVTYIDDQYSPTFSPDGGSLNISASGGNSAFASITAYAYNYSGF